MLYDHPELYDRIYDGFHDDLDLYRAMATESGGPICDLACGTGRVADALVAPGLPVVGIEVSEQMLAAARRRPNAASIELRQGDMREPLAAASSGAPYGLIIVALHSLEHLTRNEDLVAALSTIRDALAPDGRAVFALHNPDMAVLARQAGALERVHPGVHGIAVYESTSYDPVSQVLSIDWFVEMKRDTQRYSYDLRMIFPQEAGLLLAATGLELVDQWGWYDRSPLTAQSGTQVLVARRA